MVHLQIIIAGDLEAEDSKALLDVVNSFYLPNKILIVHNPGSKSFLTESLEVLTTVTKDKGKATAYVCENYKCTLPTSDPEILKKMLNPKTSH